MYPFIKRLKTGGLLLLVTGVLLVAACRNPAGGYEPAGPVIPPDTTALEAKIDEAKKLLKDLEKSEDGVGVNRTAYWVTYDEKRELEKAILDAEGIVESPNATAGQVKLALQKLQEAIDAANSAKKRGQNTNAQEEQIGNAEDLADSLKISTNGDDIPPNEEWVAEEVKKALTDAIKAANAIIIEEEATAEDVKAVLDELAAAYEAAKGAKQKGTTPDKAALDAKIEEARDSKKDVNPSETEDGSQYREDEWWVTPAVWNALEAALGAAVQVQNNENATKASVDAALANLTAALSGFIPQPGISMADKDELNDLINEIAEKLADVQPSEDGSDIYDTDEWVSFDVWNALEADLSEARAVANNRAAPQEDVDALAQILKDALEAFNPRPGKKAVGLLEFVAIKFIGPQDETITLSPDQTLSWLNDVELRVTVTETFDSYQWYVDGAIKGGETGASLTLQARSFARYSTHTVTLKVTTEGGAPYTKTLTFTVN